jgi:predicted nucleic acid-binding protein
MIVLDSNVVLEAMKPGIHLAARGWLNAQVAETLFLTSVTLAELLFGISVLPEGRRKPTLMRWRFGKIAHGLPDRCCRPTSGRVWTGRSGCTVTVSVHRHR